MDLNNTRLIGPLPDQPYGMRESFRKGLNGDGSLPRDDIRLVNTPIMESALYADGDIEILGKFGTSEFLKHHHIISFDPGSSESACSGHCMQFTLEGSLDDRAITNKFCHFGSSGLKGDNSKTGAGFEQGRTNDAEAYANYSAQFEERCEPIITQKYDAAIGMRGVGGKRKATQRARADIANMIMQMNTALNVRP